MSDELDELGQIGVPSHLVDQRVQLALNEQLGRMGTMAQELNAMRMRHPDFVRYEAAIGAEMATNPKLQEYAASDWNGALEASYHHFRNQGAPAGAPPSYGQDEALRARTQGHPADRPNVAFNSGEYVDDSVPDVDTARARYQASPTKQNMEAFARARLRQVVPSWHVSG